MVKREAILCLSGNMPPAGTPKSHDERRRGRASLERLLLPATASYTASRNCSLGETTGAGLLQTPASPSVYASG